MSASVVVTLVMGESVIAAVAAAKTSSATAQAKTTGKGRSTSARNTTSAMPKQTLFPELATSQDDTAPQADVHATPAAAAVAEAPTPVQPSHHEPEPFSSPVLGGTPAAGLPSTPANPTPYQCNVQGATPGAGVNAAPSTAPSIAMQPLDDDAQLLASGPVDDVAGSLRQCTPLVLKTVVAFASPASTVVADASTVPVEADASVASMRQACSTKRVSISTPVHVKSELPSRHIVRTPYPKSTEKDAAVEELEVDMTPGAPPNPATPSLTGLPSPAPPTFEFPADVSSESHLELGAAEEPEAAMDPFGSPVAPCVPGGAGHADPCSEDSAVTADAQYECEDAAMALAAARRITYEAESLVQPQQLQVPPAEGTIAPPPEQGMERGFSNISAAGTAMYHATALSDSEELMDDVDEFFAEEPFAGNEEQQQIAEAAMSERELLVPSGMPSVLDDITQPDEHVAEALPASATEHAAAEDAAASTVSVQDSMDAADVPAPPVANSGSIPSVVPDEPNSPTRAEPPAQLLEQPCAASGGEDLPAAAQAAVPAVTEMEVVLSTVEAAEALASSADHQYQQPAASQPRFMAPTASTTQRLKSKVVATEQYDARSLNQLRRDIKAVASKKAKKPQAVTDAAAIRHTPVITPASETWTEDFDSDDGLEAAYDQGAEDLLASAMDTLGVTAVSDKPQALKGLPLPQGRHIRFNGDGEVCESPSSGKPALHGVPKATGVHIRFDD
ncbi:hypothetical protein QJQ45_011206 [Haematococcus lacustris]|nr:hypothetical protein QJQ45_011206 [Haematococcus lacustris]